MKNKLVAYLDLLGFSNYVQKDIIGAMELLHNYQRVLTTKITDNQAGPSGNLKGPFSRTLPRNQGTDSFEYFLPFSDSIFIVSAQPNVFLRQISSFIIDSFLLTSEAYKNPEVSHEPVKVTRRDSKNMNLYPTLFRGGLSYGNVSMIEVKNLVSSQINTTLNLTGEAVVKAVKLEKTQRGPRLFFGRELYRVLDSSSKKFIASVNNSPNYFEVLWPAFHYTEVNESKTELPKFDDLFIPAANLWKAYNHKNFSQHYYELLTLIVKSSVVYFTDKDYQPAAKEYIAQTIYKCGLENKINDLLHGNE